MNDRTTDDFLVETNDAMLGFYQRNVERNKASGVPVPFTYDVDVAELKGQPFKDERAVIAEASPQKVVSPPKPTVTSVNPTSGPAAGGTHMNIVGNNFIPGCKVYYDGAPEAAGGTFTDPQHIMSVTPAHSAGQVDVEVENVTGLSDELVNAYTFLDAPTITSVSPNVGSQTGGSQVTIHGDHYTFPSGYQVAFGSNTVSATRVNSTTLTCIVPRGINPPHPSRVAVNVKVTAPDSQNATLTNGYFYTSNTVATSPSNPSVPSGVIGNSQVQCFNDLGVFDPTDNEPFQFTLLAFSNVTSISYDPNPTSVVNGVRSFIFRAVLVNPLADGSFNLAYTNIYGTTPSFFLCTVTH